jgi:hypothetical protein
VGTFIDAKIAKVKGNAPQGYAPGTKSVHPSHNPYEKRINQQTPTRRQSHETCDPKCAFAGQIFW